MHVKWMNDEITPKCWDVKLQDRWHFRRRRSALATENETIIYRSISRKTKDKISRNDWRVSISFSLFLFDLDIFHGLWLVCISVICAQTHARDRLDRLFTRWRQRHCKVMRFTNPSRRYLAPWAWLVTQPPPIISPQKRKIWLSVFAEQIRRGNDS